MGPNNPDPNNPDPKKRDSKKRDGTFAWPLLAVLFAVGAILTAIATTRWSADPAISARGLAGLLLGGVLTFTLVVGSLVSLFHAMGLTNRRFPLGLPDGTVQALIALILVVLFFVMSVFLYLDVRETTSERQLLGLTETQVQELQEGGRVVSALPRQITTGTDDAGDPILETRYDVTLSQPRSTSEVAQEMARQLITSMSTLIAAVVAFYFGAKTIGGAKPEGDDENGTTEAGERGPGGEAPNPDATKPSPTTKR